MPVDDPKVREEIPFKSSTIETIDYAVNNWVNDILNIHVTTNKGWKKVPIIWVSAERAFHIKNNPELKNNTGVVTMPVITIERTGMVKDMARKGSIHGLAVTNHDNKAQYVTIARQVNQFKSANFRNAASQRRNGQLTGKTPKTGILFGKSPAQKNRTVYETITIPVPVYVDVSYSIKLRTEYQQQMTEAITPFITRPGGFNYVNVTHEGHNYETFIQSDFSNDNNISNLGEEERKYESSVELKVLGYLIGDGKNQDRPKIVKRQNAVTVKIPRERVILGDEHEVYTDGSPGNPFYRE